LSGCPGPKSDGNGTADGPALAGVELRLLVVDDRPELAAAARQLRGEWNAQTGSEFQVESITQEEFDDTAPLAADAVICPSHQLGTLAEQKLLTPVPERLLEGDVASRQDVFRLLRHGEATWVGQPLGVPFGSPVLTCYYRADLLEKLGRRPPETWAEYQELAGLLADRQILGDAAPANDAPWHGTIEPLAPGWAGLVLLARSAPYAKHPDNYSTLFDIRTMKPLVAGPPFLRALEELVAAAKLGSPDQLRYDPTDARAAFWRGECGMALTWPTAAASGLPAETAPNVKVGFAELPGSTEVYNVRKQSWQPRGEDDDPHVPLLAVAGRMGVVARKSAHPEAAFQLLFWLSGGQFSPRVCASSEATTLFRQSHLSDPPMWVERPITPPAAAQYAMLAEKTFSREQWVFGLRIPGRPEYLAALDVAVRQAVRGERSPGEALQKAATRWQEITEGLGRDRQKSAYSHSLGREP
jgi:multiple sugar transport system substrate-binding protein